MKKNLKVILTLLMTLCLVSALTACGSSDSSKAEPLKIEIAEGIEPFEIDAEHAASLNEADVPQEIKEKGIEKYYSDSKKTADYGAGTTANPNGLSLKAEAVKESKSLKGCYEMKKTEDGTDYAAVSYFDEKYAEAIDSKTPFISTLLIFEDGDNFANILIWRYTEEAEFADSGYSFWLPTDYEEADITDEDGDAAVAKYTSSNSYLPGMTLEEWAPENKVKSLSDLIKAYDDDEDDAEIVETYSSRLPDGNKTFLCQLESEEDGTSLTQVHVVFKSGNKFERMVLDSTTEKWMGYGKAFFRSIHETE